MLTSTERPEKRAAGQGGKGLVELGKQTIDEMNQGGEGDDEKKSKETEEESKKERKERLGFLFPNSGFQGNDCAVIVLSFNLPNETRGPASPMMFISLHFSSFRFFPFICDIKIIHTESALHLNGSLLFSSSFFPHLRPFCFAHSAESSGQSWDLWLANQQRGYFLRNPLCQQLSSLLPHMLT